MNETVKPAVVDDEEFHAAAESVLREGESLSRSVAAATVQVVRRSSSLSMCQAATCAPCSPMARRPTRLGRPCCRNA